MNRGDEMAANMETGERQDGSDRVNEQLRVAFKEFLGPSPQPKPAGALHEVLAEIARHLKNGSLAIKTINDRLVAIENQTKKRSSRGFTRYLLAICIGAAATLAWQYYGEAAKNRVEQLGWTKLPATSESTAVRSSATETPQAAPVAQTAPENVTPKAPAAPLVREVNIPESPPPPPIAAAPAAAGRPPPGGARPSENTQNTAPTSASLPVALQASCGPDVQRLCRGIPWENGGVIKCLNSHRMELSPTCDLYFNEMPVQGAAQKGAPKATSPNR
jgi:hypothetical protein